MGEENRTPAAVYLDGKPLTSADMVKVPEIKMDPKAAAKLVCSLSAAWQSIDLSFEVIADGFMKWIRQTAGVETVYELETVLRWVSVDNRSLYVHYHYTKKKRIRKKYAKRILKWYRTEAAVHG